MTFLTFFFQNYLDLDKIKNLFGLEFKMKQLHNDFLASTTEVISPFWGGAVENIYLKGIYNFGSSIYLNLKELSYVDSEVAELFQDVIKKGLKLKHYKSISFNFIDGLYKTGHYRMNDDELNEILEREDEDAKKISQLYIKKIKIEQHFRFEKKLAKFVTKASETNHMKFLEIALGILKKHARNPNHEVAFELKFQFNNLESFKFV